MIVDTAVLLLELVALFFGVSLLVHISQRWLGEAKLRRWMGGRPVIAALKGIGIGFITPFCTYSAIPMFLGLRRAGVEPAGYVAFIVAAPVLDPILFGALTLIVGLEAALIYLGVAFGAAMVLALLAQRMEIGRFMKPVGVTANEGRRSLARATVVGVAGAPDCETTLCEISEAVPWRGLKSESQQAVGAAMSLLEKLGPILILGVGIGLAIELLVPVELVASATGGESAFAIPIAAGLGTPLYMSTELFVPIADSLAAVGVGLGAIVALTISGAGANIPEFVIFGRLAQARVVVVFVGYVFLVAIFGGLLAQTIVS